MREGESWRVEHIAIESIAGKGGAAEAALGAHTGITLLTSSFRYFSALKYDILKLNHNPLWQLIRIEIESHQFSP